MRSLREAFARERVDGEVVLVDCASGPGERAALEALPAEARVFLEENRGYSGGVNAGIARARAPRLFLCNADVVFHAEAVSALLHAIEDPAVGAAAPLCLWDAEGACGRRSRGLEFWDKLAERHSGRFPSLDARRFARRSARRSLALWGAEATPSISRERCSPCAARCSSASGSSTSASCSRYEETEWEDRVRAAGLRLRCVAEARVRHLFARSSSRNTDTERRRAASRRLYREQRYGRLGRALLERPRKGNHGRASRGRVRTLAEPALPARAGAWVAVSTNPSLIPFAGGPLGEEFRLPADVLASLRPGPVYLRAFGRDGRALDTGVWQRP